MASTNRYAALDTVPLKTIAQLRSVSADEDKDTLVQRLIAQDRESAQELGIPADVYEKGTPDHKSWDWDIGEDDEDGDASELIGARKPLSKMIVEERLNEDDPEIEPNEQPEADSTASSVADSKDQTVQQPSTTDHETAKKKRKRGKKGGKKVNKTKNPDSSSTEVSGLDSEPSILTDAQDADGTKVPGAIQNVLIYDPKLSEIDVIYQNHHSSGLIDVSSIASVASDAKAIIESSPSIAATEFEDSVDGQGVLGSDVMEGEGNEGIEGHLSSTTLNLFERELSGMPASTADADADSSSHPIATPVDSSASSSPSSQEFIDSAYDTIDAPKKSRKRGKKGGEKAQKRFAAHEVQKEKKMLSLLLLWAATVLVGVVGFSVGVLVRSGQV